MNTNTNTKRKLAMQSFFSILSALFVCSSVWADTHANTKSDVNHQTGPLRSYYEQIAARANAPQLLAFAASNLDFKCDHGEPKSACIDAMCKAGGFTCGFQSDLQTVVSLCKGVDGDCVASVCQQGGFTCSFKGDLTQVANLCKDSRGSCVSTVCAAGGFTCSFKSDLSSVIDLCKNADGGCIEATCKQGGFTCSFKSDLTKVVEMCKNH